MTADEFLKTLQEGLGDKIADPRSPAPKRAFVTVKPGDLVAVLKWMREKHGITFLSTITGQDLGTEFELLYHLTMEWISLTVRTRIPRENPHIPSVCGVIPGAILYERELQDMFGIVVDGIPDGRPLVLPDDWPAGQYPLRKDWSYTPPAEVIPGTPEEKS